MGPGPSMVHESVYKALSISTLGHLDPYFIQIMDAVKVQLQEVFQTVNRLTIPMSGTGSAGMETSFVNFIEPGDPVLILINGVFGMRQKDVAERLGARVDTMEYEWGTPVLVDEVAERLKQNKYKIVAMVHAETSTGVANPVAAIGELVKGTDSLFLVDSVTSLGGMEVRNREKKVPNWYLDLTMIINYWEGQKRAYHHTAPINMIYALHQSLINVLDEGLQNAWARHMEYHKVLVDGLEGMGLTMFVDPNHRLPMLNAVVVPDGVDEADVRSRLRKDYKIEIGAGLGPMAGKVWRIGLMGETCRPVYVDRILTALKEIL